MRTFPVLLALLVFPLVVKADDPTASFQKNLVLASDPYVAGEARVEILSKAEQSLNDGADVNSNWISSVLTENLKPSISPREKFEKEPPMFLIMQKAGINSLRRTPKEREKWLQLGKKMFERGYDVHQGWGTENKSILVAAVMHNVPSLGELIIKKDKTLVTDKLFFSVLANMVRYGEDLIGPKEKVREETDKAAQMAELFLKAGANINYKTKVADPELEQAGVGEISLLCYFAVTGGSSAFEFLFKNGAEVTSECLATIRKVAEHCRGKSSYLCQRSKQRQVALEKLETTLKDKAKGTPSH